MTSAQRDEVQLHSGPAVLPRVNLLPRELVEGARLRRVQGGLVAVLLAAVGAVALVASSAGSGVTDAQADVAQVQAEQSRVQRQVQDYAGVTRVYAQVAAAQAALRSAMAGEVRYSALLDDLSQATPGSVWLTNTAYTQGAAATPAGGAAASTPTGGAAPAAGSVGSVALTGVALTHDDVAAWLDVLGERKGFGRPVLQNQTEAVVAGHPVVNWTITVPVTDAALSRRYTKTGS